MDQIKAINDIDCSKMREREFATDELAEYDTIQTLNSR